MIIFAPEVTYHQRSSRSQEGDFATGVMRQRGKHCHGNRYDADFICIRSNLIFSNQPSTMLLGANYN